MPASCQEEKRCAGRCPTAVDRLASLAPGGNATLARGLFLRRSMPHYSCLPGWSVTGVSLPASGQGFVLEGYRRQTAGPRPILSLSKFNFARERHSFEVSSELPQQLQTRCLGAAGLQQATRNPLADASHNGSEHCGGALGGPSSPPASQAQQSLVPAVAVPCVCASS